MSAHYDNFDYPSYWKGREYEHKSEVIALKDLFKKIKDFNYVADVGAGYGRLTPYYLPRSKRIFLTDPSSKLLSLAKRNLKSKKIKYIHSNIDNLDTKIKKNSLDLIIMVRVLHHIRQLDKTFNVINLLLKKRGYLILEFPNKLHIKSLINELKHGNITCFLDIFPKDIRSKRSKTNRTINFFNYHPDDVIEQLKINNFDVIEIKSVSNIRSEFLKNVLTLDVLIYLEKLLQRIFSYLKLGPSLFILAMKK